MKSVGIICEYNPFHNGHLYHLNEVKRLYPEHTIILVMSGNFLQRGDISLIDKWDKTKIALYYGIDLIVELPFPFATQSADFFARGAIEILNHLKVDYVVFGSELNDVDKLKEVAAIQLSDSSYIDKMKLYLENGHNYPTALSKAINDVLEISITTPNDILGISYIKEIMRLRSNIEPVTIKRTNNYHSLELNNSIVSASSIRNGIRNNKSISLYVPEHANVYLTKDLHFIDDYFPYLKYKIITEFDNLDRYQTVDEGVANRIKKYIFDSNTLEELIMNVKTKRYTYNKIKRMLTHILCNFTKEEAKKYNHISYIRVLGFNAKGQNYLASVKKEISVPIITTYNQNLELELKVARIYGLLKGNHVIEAEYKNKPIIK